MCSSVKLCAFVCGQRKRNKAVQEAIHEEKTKEMELVYCVFVCVCVNCMRKCIYAQLLCALFKFELPKEM